MSRQPRADDAEVVGASDSLADCDFKKPSSNTTKVASSRKRTTERQRKRLAEAAKLSRKRRKDELTFLRQRVTQLQSELKSVEDEITRTEQQETAITIPNEAQAVLHQAANENRLLRQKLKSLISLTIQLKATLSQDTKIREDPAMTALLDASADFRLLEVLKEPSPLAFEQAKMTGIDVLNVFIEAFKKGERERLLVEAESVEGWDTCMVTVGSHCILRWTKKYKNYKSDHLMKCLWALTNSGDTEMKKSYSDVVDGVKVLKKVDHTSVLLEDRFRLAMAPYRFKTCYLSSLVQLRSGDWGIVYGAMPTQKEDGYVPVFLNRGTWAEGYTDGEDSGVNWVIYIDVCPESSVGGGMTSAYIVDLMAKSLPLLEVAVAQLYRMLDQ